MKDYFFLAIGLVFVALCIFFFLKNPANPNVKPLGTEVEMAGIGGTNVNVEISRTPASRERGLSGRKGLKEDGGMLFIFDEPGLYGFWMSEMKFSIDIVGTNDKKEVVWLERNLSPETYPQVFSPKIPVKYVFELPSGFIDAHQVDMGENLSFEG